VEAMGLGDRIAVLNQGRIQQIGTPDEIYHHPATTFVATFVGSPPMNLLTRDGKLFGFRPEQFLPAAAVGERPGQVIFDFAVTRVENLGSDRYVYGHLPSVDPEAKIIAKLPSTVTTPVYVGNQVPFAVSHGDLRYFDPLSGERTATGDAAVTP
jgi:multiple sugar transport system ATP-binding protein